MPLKTASRVWIVILLVLLSVMTYLDRILISIAGPGIMREFSLSATQMGLCYTAYLTAYALVMIPGGSLTDRLGPRVTLTMMALGSALFTGLTALAGKPGLGSLTGVIPSFVIVRMAMGICAAPTYPAIARMNANWMPVSERARVWGWVACGAGIGGACSPLFFSRISASWGWRGAFCVAAGASAVLGLIWFRFVRDYPAEDTAGTDLPPATPWKELLTNRDLMLLTAGYFTVNYFEYIFFFWLYYYFGQIRHMGENESAIYTTLMWISWVIMTPVGGWVSDRLMTQYGRNGARRLVIITGLTLSVILVYIGTNVTGTFATVALLCLSLGFASSSDGPYWAAAIDAGGQAFVVTQDAPEPSGGACGTSSAKPTGSPPPSRRSSGATSPRWGI